MDHPVHVFGFLQLSHVLPEIHNSLFLLLQIVLSYVNVNLLIWQPILAAVHNWQLDVAINVEAIGVHPHSLHLALVESLDISWLCCILIMDILGVVPFQQSKPNVVILEHQEWIQLLQIQQLL